MYQHHYENLVEKRMRMTMALITKTDFIDIVTMARNRMFTTKVIQSAWRQTGLVPYKSLTILDRMPNFAKFAETADLTELAILPSYYRTRFGIDYTRTPITAKELDIFARVIHDAIPTSIRPKFNKIVKVAAKSHAEVAI
jgi:hypothetical protein